MSSNEKDQKPLPSVNSHWTWLILKDNPSSIHLQQLTPLSRASTNEIWKKKNGETTLLMKEKITFAECCSIQDEDSREGAE